MKSLLLLLALLSAACAPTRLPQPTGRAEACARIAQPGVDLGTWEFCELGGAAQCGQRRGVQTVCRAMVDGEQFACDVPTSAPTQYPTQPCLAGNGGADCPAWWECRVFDHPMVSGATDPMRWCFPGPPCSSNADADARD